MAPILAARLLLVLSYFLTDIVHMVFSVDSYDISCLTPRFEVDVGGDIPG